MSFTLRRRTLRSAVAVAVAGLALIVGGAREARATRTAQEYGYFRSLSIDLSGRIPSPAELSAFERPDFDLDAWIDARLHDGAYAERLRRVYTDLLRLDVGPSVQFTPPSVVLHRVEIAGPGGRPVRVYYRQGQRRARLETDGDFCLSRAETGLLFPRNAVPTGTAREVPQAVLDAATVLVHPWWLYRDYRDPSPRDRYDSASWAVRFPGFVPVPGLLTEPDGTPTVTVRVCREEALTADVGSVFSNGIAAPLPGAPPPTERATRPPVDSPYARAHTGEPIACRSGFAFTNSADCGCGVGLERCMPGDGPANDPRAFVFPTHLPLGTDEPVDEAPQQQSSWVRFWWGQEAVHLLDEVFREDRDFREVLTGRATWVNGPLAQFYRDFAPSTCCAAGGAFDYVQPESLVDTAALPTDLLPQDTARWERVNDRGPHAAGLLTTAVFLTKYGSRRARAHAIYNAFLCRDFVAEHQDLPPSTEPDLMVRPGCSTCHNTLEPLAAYFSRVMETDWTFLPPAHFPALSSTRCAGPRTPPFCRTYYDPAFTSSRGIFLRGAYAAPDHADAGPLGAGEAVVRDPAFAPCVASTLAAAFLGRPLSSDDDGLRQQLSATLVASGYRVRALVGALVRSDAYRLANDLAPAAWRARPRP